MYTSIMIVSKLFTSLFDGDMPLLHLFTKLYFAIQLLSIKDTWRPVPGPAPLEILIVCHLSPFTIISISPG